jgi:hypothetical protein
VRPRAGRAAGRVGVGAHTGLAGQVAERVVLVTLVVAAGGVATGPGLQEAVAMAVAKVLRRVGLSLLLTMPVTLLPAS